MLEPGSASALPVDRYVDVGDVRTRYWAEGEGSPLLLIHGFGDSIETWSRVFDCLALRHRVYALDVVGAGRTDKPAGALPLSKLAAFVGDFARAVGLERTVVMGQSMGGGIALHLWLQHPDLVEGLVLLDSAGLGREMPLNLRICTLPVLGWFLTRANRKRTAAFLRSCVYDRALVTDGMVDTFASFGKLPGAHAAMLSWLRSNADIGGWRKEIVQPVVEVLERLTVPTLIVWGRQDAIIPVAHGAAAAERIPGVQFHVFDPCGHIPQLERPEELCSLVLSFLGSRRA